MRVCTDFYMDIRVPPTQMNTFIHTYIKAWVERRNTREKEMKGWQTGWRQHGLPRES